MMAVGVPGGLVLGGYWTRRSHVTLFTGPPFSKHLGVDLGGGLWQGCHGYLLVLGFAHPALLFMAPNPKLIYWR